MIKLDDNVERRVDDDSLMDRENVDKTQKMAIRRRIEDIIERKRLREEFGEFDDLD